MSKVLFDSLSWLKVNTKDYVDDYLGCTDQTREDFADEADLLKAVNSWLSDQTEIDWDDFKLSCEDEEKNHVLVTGYFMTWMGPEACGMIFKDLATAVSGTIMDGDSNPVFSITDDGVLVLDETHHDAPTSGNHYEFKILTAVGEKYYEKHINDDRRTLHEALKENKRSRNVNTKIFNL